MIIRTGIGQDSHRFLPADTSKPCVIGGLTYDDTPGFNASSDGDVVLHAICNAISSLTGILILGNALIGKPPGRLNLLPPDKFVDPKKAKEGIKVLLQPSFDAVLVGDGASILTQGKQAIFDFLK